MNAIFLQLFLLLNVFLIGALTATAVRHAKAHFRPVPVETKKPHPTEQEAHLPAAVKERLLQAAQVKFQAVLDHSADDLQRDLKTTSIQINKHLEKLGVAIVTSEMQRYRTLIDELREQSETTAVGGQSKLAEHQAELSARLDERQIELEAKLSDEMTAEKQRLTQQVDTKLADAVASFLIETLQHNVDLGAQSTYLTAMLEEHKAELTKGITDEA